MLENTWLFALYVCKLPKIFSDTISYNVFENQEYFLKVNFNLSKILIGIRL